MLNQLIYGETKSSSGGSGDFPPAIFGFSPDDTGNVSIASDIVPNELLRSKNGRLIYSDMCGLKLYTWWDFYQSTEENWKVNAYINDRLVCEDHATSHIIDYYIDRKKIYRGKSYVTIYVHMSMEDSGKEDSNWNGGAACTHRIWGGNSGYYYAAPDHRCEKGGTCGGGATFKIVFNVNAGTYRIS